MELLMILTYSAICYAIFKIFRLPVNKWTVPTAVLGGIILIALILLVMNYNHPYSRQARLYFYTTPIVPVVRGEVIEVPVTANVPLKKGDVLFRIDPRHYQYVVDRSARHWPRPSRTCFSSKAALDVALANANEATASRDRAKQSFDRYETANVNARAGGRIEPFPEIQVENQRGVYSRARRRC